MWVCPWPMSMTTALSDDFDRSRVPDHSGPLWPPPSPRSPRPCPFQYPTFHRPRPWQGRGPRRKPETCVQEIANLRWNKVTLLVAFIWLPPFPFHLCVPGPDPDQEVGTEFLCRSSRRIAGPSDGLVHCMRAKATTSLILQFRDYSQVIRALSTRVQGKHFVGKLYKGLYGLVHCMRVIATTKRCSTLARSSNYILEICASS